MVAWWHGGMLIILILTADNDGVDVCSAINPDNADEKAFLIHGLADEIRSKINVSIYQCAYCVAAILLRLGVLNSNRTLYVTAG